MEKVETYEQIQAACKKISNRGGTIQSRKEVWCGKCNKWEYLVSRKMINAVGEAKSYGWKKTKRYGWLCPLCQKKGRI